jgi:hypothetical protein
VSSPILWTWVKGSSAFFDLCLSRSASLPLHVVLSDDVPPQIITSLKPHLSRVHSLRICLPASKIHSVLDKLSTPSPVLQSFDVEIPLTKAGKQPATPKKLLKQWSTPRLPRIFPENSALTELCLRGIPLTPAFLTLSSVTTAILHHSNWPLGHILNFISTNHRLERLSIAGKMDPTSGVEPPNHLISLPHLRLLVLTNLSPDHLLCHLKVPRGTHLELNCDANIPFSNGNLENLSGLEDLRLTHRDTTRVRDRTLTGSGPSGSVRVQWAQYMTWEEIFFPLSPSRIRKLHIRNMDTYCGLDEYELALGAMNNLETIIIDGSICKGLCSALARREPTPLCPSLHTFVYCHTWDLYVFTLAQSVAECRHEAPEVPRLKRLIIATNIDLPSTEELGQLSFYVDSLELRITTQVPEAWEEPSSEW